MANKKQKNRSHTSRISNLTRTQKIVSIFLFAIVGVFLASSILAEDIDKRTYFVAGPTEKIAVSITDEKPVVFARGANNEIVPESRGASVSVGESGRVYCTEENSIVTNVKQISPAQLNALKNDLSKTSYDKKTKDISVDKSAVVGNFKSIMVARGAKAQQNIVMPGQAASPEFSRAEAVLKDICGGASQQLTTKDLPTFVINKPPEDNAVTKIRESVIPKAEAGGVGTPTIDRNLENDQFARINQERAARGLPAMTRLTCLDDTARAWSLQMLNDNWVRHNYVPNTSNLNPAPIDNACGTIWNRLGENVLRASNYSNPQLFSLFFDSTGHRANILGNFNRVGIGAYVIDNGAGTKTTYITQHFILCSGACTPRTGTTYK